MLKGQDSSSYPMAPISKGSSWTIKHTAIREGMSTTSLHMKEALRTIFLVERAKKSLNATLSKALLKWVYVVLESFVGGQSQDKRMSTVIMESLIVMGSSLRMEFYVSPVANTLAVF